MDGLLAARNTAPAASGPVRRDIRGKLTLARLPAMSPILLQLLDLCERDDLNLGDLAQLIKRDVGMVARIFAVSSSDVERLAMLATDPEGYKQIFHEDEDGEALCAVEQTVFALTHAEVGAWLLEKWALDSFLGDCVLYHQEPLERMVSAPLLMRMPRAV